MVYWVYRQLGLSGSAGSCGVRQFVGYAEHGLRKCRVLNALSRFLHPMPSDIPGTNPTRSPHARVYVQGSGFRRLVQATQGGCPSSLRPQPRYPVGRGDFSPFGRSTLARGICAEASVGFCGTIGGLGASMRPGRVADGRSKGVVADNLLASPRGNAGCGLQLLGPKGVSLRQGFDALSKVE